MHRCCRIAAIVSSVEGKGIATYRIRIDAATDYRHQTGINVVADRRTQIGITRTLRYRLRRGTNKCDHRRRLIGNSNNANNLRGIACCIDGIIGDVVATQCVGIYHAADRHTQAAVNVIGHYRIRFDVTATLGNNHRGITVQRDQWRFDVRHQHLADAMVVGIRYIEIACHIQRQSVRLIQLRRCGGAVIPRVTGDTTAGNGGDDAGGDTYLADTLVVLIGNVEIANSIHRDPAGIIQLCHCRQTAITAKSERIAYTGYSTDDAVAGIHLADTGDKLVCDIKIVGTVDGDPGRVIELSGCCRATISA